MAMSWPKKNGLSSGLTGIVKTATKPVYNPQIARRCGPRRAVVVEGALHAFPSRAAMKPTPPKPQSSPPPRTKPKLPLQIG